MQANYTSIPDGKDNLLKYVEMPRIFNVRSSEIQTTSRQHIRKCEEMAKMLAGRRANNVEDQHRIDKMKDFLIASVDLNENIVKLIDEMYVFLSEVAQDAKELMQGAQDRDRFIDYGESLVNAWEQRDKLVKMYADERRKNTAATQ